MDNYRSAFRLYVYKRLAEYQNFEAPIEMNTPQKYNAYAAIRAVIALRFEMKPFKCKGNRRMDYETYVRYCRAVDEILPPKEE